MTKNQIDYKQTEIGEIPEDWEVSTLNKLSQDIISGGTPSRCNKLYYQNGTIPWIKTQELLDRFIYDTEEKITPEALNKSSAKLVPQGTISIAMYGATVGKLGILGTEAATNQACCNIITDSKELDNRFLFYSLLYKRSELTNMASGAAQQNLNVGLIKNFKIAFPGVQEQQQIALILSSLDDKIELNRKMNKTLEEVGKALFKRWFVDFEFPDKNGKPYKFNGSEMVDSELGPIPKGWRVIKIDYVVSIKGGTTPSTKNTKYWDGSINWATPKDLSGLQSSILLNTDRKITEEGLKTIGSGLLPSYSILLSSRAPIGYLVISNIPVAINQGFIGIVCDKGLSPYHMYFWVLYHMDLIKSKANGSTFLEVSKSSFKNIDFIMTSTPILNKFQQVVTPLFQNITNNEIEIQSLSQIRDSLLPRLMSGKLRVCH